MRIGDVMNARSIVHVQPKLSLTFKAGRKRVFHFLYLGSSADGEDFDPVAVLHDLGWSLPEGEEVEGRSSVPLAELFRDGDAASVPLTPNRSEEP